MGADLYFEAQKPENVAAYAKKQVLNEVLKRINGQIATVPVASAWGQGCRAGLERAKDILQDILAGLHNGGEQMAIGTTENGWHEGEKLGNRNVPVGAKVLGSVVAMSGEIVDTLYYDPVKKAIYKVCGWKGSKPQMIM